MPKIRTSHHKAGPRTQAEVVCFGMVTNAVVLAVDQLPAQNTGTMINQVAEIIADDAAIVACLLRQWGVVSGLVGTTLGDDPPGRKVARKLRELGVLGKLRVSRHVDTPLEVSISDKTGARTYYWKRDAHVLDTLDTADLSVLGPTSRLLYVDWYDGDHILRPMILANRLGIPVFLNLEYGHQDPEILSRYASGATICQAVTDPSQSGSDYMPVARKLLEAGVDTALVTLGGGGCLAVRGREILRARPPVVQVVDGCGAGATFSAGFIYGYLRSWDLEATVRFATAAASLKCTVTGTEAFAPVEVTRLAAKVKVERLGGVDTER